MIGVYARNTPRLCRVKYYTGPICTVSVAELAGSTVCVYVCVYSSSRYRLNYQSKCFTVLRASRFMLLIWSDAV